MFLFKKNIRKKRKAGYCGEKASEEGGRRKRRISTKYCSQYAEIGENGMIILYNMLIESFGAILYTENTPKETFGISKKKTADSSELSYIKFR